MATSTRNLDTGSSTPLFDERAPLLTTSFDLEHQNVRRTRSSVSLAFLGDQSTTWDWPKIKQRTHYYVPGTAWIPHYSLSQLKGDALAGITVACILIPQSISYATSLANLGPVSGLISASIPALVYAIFGSSRQLNVAPEAALSLLIGQAIASMIRDHSPDNIVAFGIAVTTIITFQTGLFTFLLGIIRLGFLDVVLSRALLRGFITAIGIVILIEQCIPLLGLVALQHSVTPPPETPFEKFLFILENIPQVHVPTALVGFGSFGILVLVKYLKIYIRKHFHKMNWIQSIPEIFIVVVISTALSQSLRWDKAGVAILGTVKVSTRETNFFAFPLIGSNLRYMTSTTSTAILCALIGYLDSMVSAKQNSARFGYSISSNRELVALGAANITASLMPGTLPAYGSITRSRLNADLGCTSQMSSFICSALILLATFFLLPFLTFLPKPVLSAIVSLVIITIVAELPHDLGFYWRMRSYPDLSLMLLTFVLTIIWNIEIGVVVSFIISLLLIVRRSSKVRISILGRLPGTDRWKPISEDPDAEELIPSGILIIRIRENLDFANTAQLKERLRRLELFGHAKHHPSEQPRREQARTLGFHMSDVESIDASAVQIFYELLETYRQRQANIFLTMVQPNVYEAFKRAGIMELIGENRVYLNLSDAIADFEMAEVR